MKKSLKKFIFRIYVVFFLFFAMSLSAEAKAISVTSISEINTSNPNKIVIFRLNETPDIENFYDFRKGDVIFAKFQHISSESRLKRDARFVLKLTYYQSAITGETKQLKNLYAKYTTKVDKAETVKSAALSVGSFFVKPLNICYRAAEGAIKNEEGIVAKSTAKAVYEASPFSLIEKGEALIIKENEQFLLNIKYLDEINSDFIYNFIYKINESP